MSAKEAQEGQLRGCCRGQGCVCECVRLWSCLCTFPGLCVWNSDYEKVVTHARECERRREKEIQGNVPLKKGVCMVCEHQASGRGCVVKV